jgi:hypothetical protein
MKRKHFAVAMLTGGLCLLLIGACKHMIPYPIDNGVPGGTGNVTDSCDPSKIYFQQQILPILVSNCAQSGCHDNGSHREGVVLVSYSSVMQTGGVRAGDPSRSKLYNIIADGSMPPRGYSKLSTAQFNLIYQWIQQGAKDLVCQNMCDSGVYSYSAAIQPLIANKCEGCHNTSNALGGVNLSTYTGVKAEVSSGRLWGSVNGSPGYVQMPQNGSKLSDCELAQIQKWIADGAPNN